MVNRLRHWLWNAVRGSSLWALIAILGVSFVIVWLYRVNQDAAVRNERLLAQHRQTLAQAQQAVEYLCETTQTLDVLVKQFIATGLRTLPTIPFAQRPLYEEQIQALSAAHIVLSDTRACREVTG